jgi:hypothetical protein
VDIDIKGISGESGRVETNLRKHPGVNATRTGCGGFRAAVYFFDSEDAAEAAFPWAFGCRFLQSTAV